MFFEGFPSVADTVCCPSFIWNEDESIQWTLMHHNLPRPLRQSVTMWKDTPFGHHTRPYMALTTPTRAILDLRNGCDN